MSESKKPRGRPKLESSKSGASRQRKYIQSKRSDFDHLSCLVIELLDTILACENKIFDKHIIKFISTCVDQLSISSSESYYIKSIIERSESIKNRGEVIDVSDVKSEK